MKSKVEERKLEELASDIKTRAMALVLELRESGIALPESVKENIGAIARDWWAYEFQVNQYILGQDVCDDHLGG